MLPSEYKPRSVRPISEIINPGRFMSETDIAGNWYEDLQNYESNLDEMASATLDQTFKDEMQHVDQWYRYLTDAEKTATMYTLLQHSTQVQARFFINLLQQMVKRDPLYSLLTPNPEQDMQNHLAGAMAKAELEASQRLMSVLPYKTGQVMSRPQGNTANRRTTMDRHSFALGDTEEYNHLFESTSNRSSSSAYVNSLLEDNTNRLNTMRSSSNTSSSNNSTSGRTMFNSSNGRPHSVIEGDTTLLFPTASSSSSNWLGNGNHTSSRRQPTAVGHIGDRSNKSTPERPKSADISHWSLPTVWNAQNRQTMDNDLINFANSVNQQPFRTNNNNTRRAAVSRIPAVVPETEDEQLLASTQNLFLNDHSRSDTFGTFPTSATSSIVDNSSILDEPDYASDHSEASNMSRRRSSMANSRVNKEKKGYEGIDMELLKDIPAWLRSLRLHKYNAIFCDSDWKTIVKMDDAQLLRKGVAALGARRKMLKVFENIREHCDKNHIEY